MFKDALLESSPTVRKRSRWAMATAFTAELIVAAVLVLLPLVSTGVISLKATVIVPTPKYTPLEKKQPMPPASGSRSAVSAPVARVIPISASGITYGKPVDRNTNTDSSDTPPDLNLPGGGDPKGPDLGLRGTPLPVKPVVKPPLISHTTEAMLLRKIVPEYPQIAKLSGIQGDVKLHAFVSRNGDIISLAVLGNPPPVLSQAALAAVQQWKYRPYYLNGEPVEIETFITVTFKRE